MSVPEKSPAMVAAISAARTNLPRFWQALERPTGNEGSFALKVKISDPNGVEHFWVNDVQRKDGKIFGTINNEPNVVRNVKLGDRVEVAEANISDWLYLRDHKMVGNYTLRALFEQMSPAEAAMWKQRLADP